MSGVLHECGYSNVRYPENGPEGETPDERDHRIRMRIKCGLDEKPEEKSTGGKSRRRRRKSVRKSRKSRKSRRRRQRKSRR